MAAMAVFFLIHALFLLLDLHLLLIKCK